MTQMAAGFRCVFPEIGSCAAALLLAGGACVAPPAADPAEDAPPAAPAAPSVQQPPDAPSLAELRAAAAVDPGAALAQFDGAAGAYARSAEFWECYGRATLDLFERGQRAGRANAFLPADALSCFETAVALEPGRSSALAGLATARQLVGDLDGAWAAAEQAWNAAERSTAAPAALAEIGQVGLALTQQSLRRGAPAPAAARIAENALGDALAGGLDAAAVPLFDLHAAQGQWEAAAATALRGLCAVPPIEDLYARLRQFSGPQRNQQVAVLEEARRLRPQDGLLLWYLGEALFFQGRETRTGLDTLKAREAFDRADEAFAQAQAARPDFAGSCQEWQHLIRVQRAWTLRDEGRETEAAAAALDALRAAPERLETRPDPDSLRLLLEAVVADRVRAEDLAAARDLMRAICQLHDGDANWFNNLGFFSRELGVAAAAAGRAQEAAGDFEESWTAYSRAAELAPEDARIVNDRALIAVYYLDEHWDLAERELHRAIDLGSRQLAEMPADVPEQEHRYVDEAVGDAWENLAYLQLIRRHQTDHVEDYLNASAQHYPGAQRGGVARLRAALEAARHP